MPSKQDVVYLGAHLNCTNDTTKEVKKRIQAARHTFHKLYLFWRHSNCKLGFKLQVASAVLYAKVLYGLESAELTQTALHHLDTFQLKILRKFYISLQPISTEHTPTNTSTPKQTPNSAENSCKDVAPTRAFPESELYYRSANCTPERNSDSSGKSRLDQQATLSVTSPSTTGHHCDP